MREPIPAMILDCSHVEHPIASGYCQTADCPNVEPERHVVYEWGSVVMVGLILWYVQHATGQGLVDILMDSLPRLFTS